MGFAAGPAGCEDWMKVLCTALQPWHLLVSARRLWVYWSRVQDGQLTVKNNAFKGNDKYDGST